MATRLYLYGLLIGLATLSGSVARSQTLSKRRAAVVLPSRPVTLDEPALRQAIFDTAATFVGLTERSNNNDADWIALINRVNGLPDRSAYCASAYYYMHAKNGVKLPVVSKGSVSSYFRVPTRVIYKRNGRGNQRIGSKPQLMDAVSLFVSHIEGIADLHFDPEEQDRVRLIGFNTTAGNGTRGGCYINTRRTSEIKAIANWVTPYLATYPNSKPLAL